MASTLLHDDAGRMFWIFIFVHVVCNACFELSYHNMLIFRVTGPFDRNCKAIAATAAVAGEVLVEVALAWVILVSSWDLFGKRLDNFKLFWDKFGGILGNLGAMLAHLGTLLSNLGTFLNHL